MLKTLEGEDIAHIDINSDEGIIFNFLSKESYIWIIDFLFLGHIFNKIPYIHLGLAQIESMVGDKMAKKLIDSIGDILGTSKPKKEKQDKKETFMSIEEITLPSGEKQSRIIEGAEIGDDLIEVKTKEIIEKKEEKDKDPKTTIDELTKQIKEVNDKMEKMLGQVEENRKKIENEEESDGPPLSLDPRSDLSDEK